LRVVIALPDGFPLAYEVMKGNTSDRSTLRDFLDKKSVFRSLKSELGIRPIYHPLEHRADAHILICLSGPLLTDHLEAGSLAARTWVDAGGQCWRSQPKSK